ncbi:hypothetical protein A2112_02225 [Candidatus Woesebacteria bacterium GWA1_42_12]|uniref:Phosphatidic acid phosphatase type 2/haloperoxidase domain-containing protein n=1 Tax=Candidatus Woesebacteria bacterium GWA1_42_12 TaxID=1802472 RepID=A0A1F7WLN3_9BACT|nr:MAG: hypothetical protein A2112_02225 [Candidatus Woesebacteria bacterium GWA1_42_12]
MSESIVTFLASFLIWVMFFGVLVLWLIDGRIKKEVALHAILASVLAWILAEMIKNLLPSIRPFNVNGLTPLTLTVPIGGAFPSGHAASAFAASTSIFLHKKGLGIIFLLAALGVGVGRVLSNVHFPLDIVGGGVLGILSAILIKRTHLFGLLKKKK